MIKETSWTFSPDNPTVCTEICGDGILTVNQDCDDRNVFSGDGCDSSCKVEEGFTATNVDSGAGTILTTLTTICGDSIIVGLEKCELTNQFCESDCLSLRIGWYPDDTAPTGYVTRCGDGII
jgi:cysteine-rich repeat protein